MTGVAMPVDGGRRRFRDRLPKLIFGRRRYETALRPGNTSMNRSKRLWTCGPSSPTLVNPRHGGRFGRDTVAFL